MKRLIVNADDFGFTRGINAGILQAFKSGILTSTSVMANGDAFEDAVELARNNPELSVGIHLVAVGGRPVAPLGEVQTLANGGRLPRSLWELIPRLVRGAVLQSEVEREFRAQLQRAVDAGIRPTHLDTHKHAHSHPLIMQAVARVAAEFGIGWVRNPFESLNCGLVSGPLARANRGAFLKQYVLSVAVAPRGPGFRRRGDRAGLRWPDQFFGVALTGLLDSAAIRAVMDEMTDGVAELMCHPGLYDEDLERAPTRLKRERERELEALIDPSVKEFARERGIELVGYRELA